MHRKYLENAHKTPSNSFHLAMGMGEGGTREKERGLLFYVYTI